jgi:hypothetical protein
MTPAGFEPTISANEWPQTHALGRAAIYTSYVWPNLAAANSPMIKAPPHVGPRLHNQQYGQAVRQVNK